MCCSAGRRLPRQFPTSAGDFQDIKSNNVPLYQTVAKKIKDWSSYGNCGAVVGATYPDELKKIREILGENIPILIPGIGAQGGDIGKTVINGTNKNSEMVVIVSSRSIIYAGKDKNFSDMARKSAEFLCSDINKFR